jgi:hypothetical protein
VAVVVASLALGLLLYGAAHDGKVYQGVSVAGIDIGGMTETEAGTPSMPSSLPI